MDNSRARYIEINVKCYEGHRSYEEDVPVFLHKRPSQMVAYIFKEHWHTTIIGKKDNDGIPRKVIVTSHSSLQVHYGDSSNLPQCTCQDWRHYRLPCKHMCACWREIRCILCQVDQWGNMTHHRLSYNSPRMKVFIMLIHPENCSSKDNQLHK